jgi:beta-glucosidase
VVRELTMESSVGDWFAHPLVGPALMAGLTQSMTAEQQQQADANPDGLRMVESMPMQQFLVFTNGAIPAEALDQLIDLSKAPAPVV